MTTLGDLLADAQPGFACGKEDPTGVFQFRMNNVTTDGRLDLSARRRVPSSAHKSIGRFTLAPGDVLFNATNSPENVGKSALVPELGEPAVFSNHFLRLRTHPARLDPGYLARWLQWNFATGVFRSMCKQWVNQATVGRDRLLAAPIEPPPLEEQRRIAAILDQADALRAKRRQMLAHLDALKGSTFDAMFGGGGDRWTRIPLGDLVSSIDSGTSPNCESRSAEASEWGVLKLGAVTYGTFEQGENKAYLGDLGGMTANEVRAGDVLMTRKNTRQLVGAVALVDDVRPRLLLPDLIFRLHLDGGRINRRYFQALMMNHRMRPAVQALSSGSAGSMPNISKARLAGLPIDLPPLEIQESFARHVAKIQANRCVAARSRAVDDKLFGSLQARAFCGDL